jgi:hypothetical protein
MEVKQLFCFRVTETNLIERAIEWIALYITFNDIQKLSDSHIIKI